MKPTPFARFTPLRLVLAVEDREEEQLLLHAISGLELDHDVVTVRSTSEVQNVLGSSDLLIIFHSSRLDAGDLLTKLAGAPSSRLPPLLIVLDEAEGTVLSLPALPSATFELLIRPATLIEYIEAARAAIGRHFQRAEATHRVLA